MNEKYNLHGKINNVMCMYMLKILGYDKEEIKDLEHLIEKTYNSKGTKVVENNW